MADYDPNVPVSGSENISVSQPKIMNNFQQLNTIFEFDHWTWNNATVANRGLHRQISFPSVLGADPAIGSNQGILYTKGDPNDVSARPQMYFENTTAGGKIFQITNRFINSQANNGYIILPNGTDTNRSIIVMWGNVNASSSSIPAIMFPTISNYTGAPQGFPNLCFGIFLTQEGPSASGAPTIILNTFGTQQFTVRISASVPGTTLYWLAIGN